MKFQLTINAITTATLFGIWQKARIENDPLSYIPATCFMLLLLGTVFSLTDYIIEKLNARNQITKIENLSDTSKSVDTSVKT